MQRTITKGRVAGFRYALPQINTEQKPAVGASVS